MEEGFHVARLNPWSSTRQWVNLQRIFSAAPSENSGHWYIRYYLYLVLHEDGFWDKGVSGYQYSLEIAQQGNRIDRDKWMFLCFYKWRSSYYKRINLTRIEDLLVHMYLISKHTHSIESLERAVRSLFHTRESRCIDYCCWDKVEASYYMTIPSLCIKQIHRSTFAVQYVLQMFLVSNLKIYIASLRVHMVEASYVEHGQERRVMFERTKSTAMMSSTNLRN